MCLWEKRSAFLPYNICAFFAECIGMLGWNLKHIGTHTLTIATAYTNTHMRRTLIGTLACHRTLNLKNMPVVFCFIFCLVNIMMQIHYIGITNSIFTLFGEITFDLSNIFEILLIVIFWHTYLALAWHRLPSQFVKIFQQTLRHLS